MKCKNHLFAILIITIFAWQQAKAQALLYVDNALNYSRLIIQQTPEGHYKMIGTFKVIGTPYLYGEKNSGDIFSTEEKAWNIKLNYNTYTQEVEFYTNSNPDKPLVKAPGTLDSFIMRIKAEPGKSGALKFVYGSVIGSSEKSYFQEVCTGGRFNLYKRYKSDLGYVSTNYIQSELRQFDLLYDYFYTDSTVKGVKKIKPNSFAVNKEFKQVKDVSSVASADDYTRNPEEAFCTVFTYLNKQ
jgi:hypothetical protein